MIRSALETSVEERLQNAADSITTLTELSYFCQLLANLGRRVRVKPDFTVAVLTDLLLGRLREDEQDRPLLFDCVRKEDQVAELRFLLEKCLALRIVAKSEFRVILEKLEGRLETERVFASEAYQAVVANLR